MSLNNKQKLLCQSTTTELYPNETKSKPQQENDGAAFGSDALD